MLIFRPIQQCSGAEIADTALKCNGAKVKYIIITRTKVK